MRWTFKKNTESSTIIYIGYSYGFDESCDGVIVYDKKKEEAIIEKHSKTCDEFDSKRALQFVYGLIEDDQLNFEKYTICTG